eukprot:CAMPEP_0197279252 /NCGR_PEP_ID=MMETSP1432-20130617/19830_1 /TAXON_ID=44447 /ORGANISM="Pseudo-nitzschia delicatissima, Strain UNC1205" /LENGTH=51 /DNA_ID=CAMNT_0042745763 /DNA_START=118 /DNA_END=270 /DNA_ORIENTATION=-
MESKPRVSVKVAPVLMPITENNEGLSDGESKRHISIGWKVNKKPESWPRNI